MSELSEAAKAARAEYLRQYRAGRTEEQKARERAYKRRWAKANPEKQKEYTRRYWEKKGAGPAPEMTEPAE